MNEFIQRVRAFLDKKGLDYQIFLSNQEDDKPMFLADWNKLMDEKNTIDKLEKACDKYEVRLEFDDEWEECFNCSQAIRTSPTSWDWKPQYLKVGYYEPGDFLAKICKDCIQERYELSMQDLEEFVQEYSDNPDIALPDWMTGVVKELGYKCTNEEYETGFHSGQNDSPYEVSKEMRENHPEKNYVFVITAKGQFDINWTVYIKECK